MFCVDRNYYFAGILVCRGGILNSFGRKCGDGVIYKEIVMEEKRELVAFLMREYGFQFKNMDGNGHVQAMGDSMEQGGEYRGWAALASREERCLVSLDGWEIPVRDALSDIVAAAERVLQDGGQSFLAELDDDEMVELLEMVSEEIRESQYYPYPTVSRGDREFAGYALDMAVLCDRPEEVKQAAWNLEQFVENVGSFGNALRDIYGSPFWMAVTLEPHDITKSALPRMAVEVIDDLEGASLGLGDFYVRFPEKIYFSFDGTEEGFVDEFEKALEKIAGEMEVASAGETDREGCLEMVRQAFREESVRMVKSFQTNFFEDSHAGEWWHDTLGMDAGEVVGYIQDQDARSRMGALKEMYRLRTLGGRYGLPDRENLEELARIGESFQKDSHQGVAGLASSIRDAAERGMRALGRMEIFRDVMREAAGDAVREGAGDVVQKAAGADRDSPSVGKVQLFGRMPDVGRLDSPVLLEVHPGDGKECFHISLEAEPMAYRHSAYAARWPVLEKAADALERKEMQAGKKCQERKKGTVER